MPTGPEGAGVGGCLQSLLGSGPYPFPMSSLYNIFAVHSGGGLGVLELRTPVDLDRGTHTHDSFEIMLPLSAMPDGRFGRRTLGLEPRMAVPVNSQQEHGSPVPMPACRFLAIQVDNRLMRQVARDMFGSETVTFTNQAFSFDAELRYFLEIYRAESEANRPGHAFMAASIAQLLVAGILRRAPGNRPAAPQRRDGYRHTRIGQAIAYMRDNLDCELTLAEAANAAGLSPFHFIRAFRAETGQTPHEYLVNLRIERACQLLRDTDRSVTDICFLSGFTSPSHFSSTFRRIVGVSPREYRR